MAQLTIKLTHTKTTPNKERYDAEDQENFDGFSVYIRKDKLPTPPPAVITNEISW